MKLNESRGTLCFAVKRPGTTEIASEMICHDRPFAEKLADAFEKQHGIKPEILELVVFVAVRHTGNSV